MKAKRKQPKFWRRLVVMRGDGPILIGDIDWDQEDGYAYQDYGTGIWWSEDSLYRLTDFQAGFARQISSGICPPNLYYRRGR